jgi:hypothetical protein
LIRGKKGLEALWAVGLALGLAPGALKAAGLEVPLRPARIRAPKIGIHRSGNRSGIAPISLLPNKLKKTHSLAPNFWPHSSLNAENCKEQEEDAKRVFVVHSINLGMQQTISRKLRGADHANAPFSHKNWSTNDSVAFFFTARRSLASAPAAQPSPFCRTTRKDPANASS